MQPMNNHTNGEKRVVSFFIWVGSIFKNNQRINSFVFKDPELERKINCEVKMIDGISKLLNVVTKIQQTIECHKALVLSQQRLLAFMSEIQRKQQNLLKRDSIEYEICVLVLLKFISFVDLNQQKRRLFSRTFVCH
jgi:hypothetical protein